MKCLKAIKPTKHIEVGTVKRVDDFEAPSMVATGYWGYTSKTEYKKYLGTVEPVLSVNQSVDNKKESIKKVRGKKH